MSEFQRVEAAITEMGKKNKSKVPKGRAGAKQKAKKGGPSTDWSTNFVRSSGVPRQIQDGDDDDDGKFLPGKSDPSLLPVAKWLQVTTHFSFSKALHKTTLVTFHLATPLLNFDIKLSAS